MQFSLVAQSCPTLCNRTDSSMPDLPFHHQLPELTQTHVHWIGDEIQPSHPLSIPFSSCLQSFLELGSFPSSQVCMWKLEYKESWVPKNWCFWPVVVEKILESPLDWNEVQPVHPKGDQSWILIGRTDDEAETPIFGHLMQRTNPGKDPDAGKEWSGLEKGTTEDEMVG